MKITTIRILAALLLGTALSGCLSSSGVSTSPPADTGTGGDSGSGSGGDDGGEGTGGDTDGSGGDDDTDDDMDSGGDDDTGDTGDGGDAGSGGLTESDFDAELERIQSMDLSTSMPSDLSASYDGQVKMTAADFEDGFRTLTVMGDLALDLEYSALGTNTAQANTWTGGVTNLHGTSVVADINGEVVEDLDVQGSLTVMPQVTGRRRHAGTGIQQQRQQLWWRAADGCLHGCLGDGAGGQGCLGRRAD